jgi:hypothetical protein
MGGASWGKEIFWSYFRAHGIRLTFSIIITELYHFEFMSSTPRATIWMIDGILK